MKKHFLKLFIVLLIVIVLAMGVYFINIQEGMTSSSSTDKNSLYTYSPTMNNDASLNITKYDSNNFNIQYHDNLTDIQAQGYANDSSINTIKFHDMSTGNTIAVPVSEIQGNVTYYEPGTYRFGASSYVPSYEDSVYLSKTTGVSQVGKLYNTASMMAGFCSQNKNNTDKLEESCRALNKNECASTSCCVLLGGSKCVYGNEMGPVVKSNYSDFFIKNRDFYYYQGKCYGNCQS